MLRSQSKDIVPTTKIILQGSAECNKKELIVSFTNSESQPKHGLGKELFSELFVARY